MTTISRALDGAFTCLKAKIRLGYQGMYSYGVTADGAARWRADHLDRELWEAASPRQAASASIDFPPIAQFPRSSPPPAIPRTICTPYTTRSVCAQARAAVNLAFLREPKTTEDGVWTSTKLWSMDKHEAFFLQRSQHPWAAFFRALLERQQVSHALPALVTLDAKS